MQKLLSTLSLVVGFALLLTCILTAGAHESHIRKTQIARARYGYLENRIAADQQEALTAFNRYAHACFYGPAGAVDQAQSEETYIESDERDAFRDLGTHSSTARAEELLGMYRQRSLDDVALEFSAALLLLGIVLTPRKGLQVKSRKVARDEVATRKVAQAST